MAIINFILLNKKENLPVKSAQVIAFVEHMKLICGSKEDIDLRPNIAWQTQFSEVFGSKKQQKSHVIKLVKLF